MNGAVLRHLLVPIALHPDGIPLRLPAHETTNGSLRLIHGPEPVPQRTSRALGAAQLLFHATGLETRDARFIGHDEGRLEHGTMWHAYLCRIKPPVRDRWKHVAPGGMRILRWCRIDSELTLSDADAACLRWIRSLL